MFTQNLNPNSFSKKTKFSITLLIHTQRWTGFLVILLTTLRNKFIDRPKLTERKKKPVEHTVPLPTIAVGTENAL